MSRNNDNSLLVISEEDFLYLDMEALEDSKDQDVVFIYPPILPILFDTYSYLVIRFVLPRGIDYGLYALTEITDEDGKVLLELIESCQESIDNILK